MSLTVVTRRFDREAAELSVTPRAPYGDLRAVAHRSEL
jgi:hypothetical protein